MLSTLDRKSDAATRYLRVLRGVAATAALYLAALAASGPGHATDIYVTTFDDDAPDDGTCSLREAVRASSQDIAVDACAAGEVEDRILLGAGTYRVDLTTGEGEDVGLTGDLDIFGFGDTVELVGLGPSLTVIDGDPETSADRVLHIVDDSVTATIRGMTIRGGRAANGLGGNVLHESGLPFLMIDVALADGVADAGGGFAANAGSGAATLLRVAVTANRADRGAGLYANNARFKLESSLVSGNTANDFGGGLALDSSDEAVIVRSRIESNNAPNRGGGIFATGGDVRVIYSAIAENTSAEGAGVFDESLNGMRVRYSALLDNAASADGGGFYGTADAVIRDTTIAANSADNGGGLFANTGMLLMDAVTIADNTGGGVHNEAGAFFEASLLAANSDGNCTGDAPSGFFYNLDDGDTCGFPENDPTQPNFVNTDPMLGPLADNGGATPTFALGAGSPAIDAVDPAIKGNCANPASAPVFDQRGYPRGIDRSGGTEPRCDIGAFEVNPPYLVDSMDDTDGQDADAGDGVCATSAGVCTLRAAIQEANAIQGLEEILLPAGTYTFVSASAEDPNDPAASGDLDVLDPVVVRGAGALDTVVDAARIDRAFELPTNAKMGVESPPPASGLWLADLSIVNGLSEFGGAIRASDALYVTRAILQDNESNNDGGAIVCDDDCSVTLSLSRVSGNTAANGIGGALFQADDGTATIDSGRAVIERSELSGNVAAGGGGAIVAVRLELRNSTVSGNTSQGATSNADGGGGALFWHGSVASSTIVDNQVAIDQGGGLRAFFAGAIANTLLAGNTDLNALPDNCRSPDMPGSFVSLGGNLTETAADDCALTEVTDLPDMDPSIEPLADNGGIGRTHALLAGSAAVDAGLDEHCPETDQRGFMRPGDGDGDGTAACDIGAYEIVATDADLAVSIDDAPDPVLVGGEVTYTVRVTNNGPAAASLVIARAAIPAGLTFATGSGSAACAESGGVVECALGDLGPGNSVEAAIVATAARNGQAQVTVEVSAFEVDNDPSNDSATATTTVNAVGGGGPGGGVGSGGGGGGGAGGPLWMAALWLLWAYKRVRRYIEVRGCAPIAASGARTER